MAIINGVSLVAWGSSTILALLILYHLNAAGFLSVLSEEKVDASLQSPTSSGQASAPWISVNLPDEVLSQKDYLVTSVYRTATHVPRLHRKLNTFRNLQISQKLPQSTTPPPQGPSPISNRVHLLELSADNSGSSRKEQYYQMLPQSTTPPPQGPSPISNRVHLQELSAESSVNSFRKELNFQKLPQDTTPPPQGPSPISNRVHLQELSADSSINSYRNEQNFQKLPQTTTPPPQGPSPIANRVHLQELLDDNLESQKQSIRTRGDYSPIRNHVQMPQDVSDDKTWQDQSNSPSSSTMLHDLKKNIMKSARRYLRSIDFNVEAVSRKLQGTQSPPLAPSPTQNRFHLQEISTSSSASTRTNALLKPSPLPPRITKPSDSLQTEEKRGGGGRLVFQMLPRDTAPVPSGPDPIHN